MHIFIARKDTLKVNMPCTIRFLYRVVKSFVNSREILEFRMLVYLNWKASSFYFQIQDCSGIWGFFYLRSSFLLSLCLPRTDCIMKVRWARPVLFHSRTRSTWHQVWLRIDWDIALFMKPFDYSWFERILQKQIFAHAWKWKIPPIKKSDNSPVVSLKALEVMTEWLVMGPRIRENRFYDMLYSKH